jgi:hypothetical protein
MTDTQITCARCGEVQSSDVILCARCGASLETTEQKKARLKVLEQSRRAAEHDDVSIQRLPGFGTNGTPRAAFGSRSFFSEMSNQLRRRYIVATVIVAAAAVFLITR